MRDEPAIVGIGFNARGQEPADDRGGPGARPAVGEHFRCREVAINSECRHRGKTVNVPPPQRDPRPADRSAIGSEASSGRPRRAVSLANWSRSTPIRAKTYGKEGHAAGLGPGGIGGDGLGTAATTAADNRQGAIAARMDANHGPGMDARSVPFLHGRRGGGIGGRLGGAWVWSGASAAVSAASSAGAPKPFVPPPAIGRHRNGSQTKDGLRIDRISDRSAGGKIKNLRGPGRV
jgi:hypothetical protein